MAFRKASRSEQFLRMSIQGASGSGKTRSALEIAKHLAGPSGKIALIDTEKSAALYSTDVAFDVDDDFGAIGKENYHQDVWKKKLLAAAAEGYKVVILDSATHLWKGPGGFLAQIEAISQAAKARGGKYDSFAAWKTVDPLYMNFMQFIRALPMHVIFCIRSKTEYERSEAGGKGSLKKVGLSPEYRENFEYEFDIQCSIDTEHLMVPLKHRLGDVLDGQTFLKPGKDFAEICMGWLQTGAAEGAKAAVDAEIAAKAAPKQPVPPFVDAEDATPDSGRDEVPTTERHVPDAAVNPVDSFVTLIEAAATLGDLKAVAQEIKTALNDKQITQADYNEKLSPVYAARNRFLKAA